MNTLLIKETITIKAYLDGFVSGIEICLTWKRQIFPSDNDIDNVLKCDTQCYLKKMPYECKPSEIEVYRNSYKQT